MSLCARFQTTAGLDGHRADAVAMRCGTPLEGFHGAMGSTHVHAMVLNRIDDYDEDAARWRVILDARLLYRDV